MDFDEKLYSIYNHIFESFMLANQEWQDAGFYSICKQVDKMIAALKCAIQDISNNSDDYLYFDKSKMIGSENEDICVTYKSILIVKDAISSFRDSICDLLVDAIVHLEVVDKQETKVCKHKKKELKDCLIGVIIECQKIIIRLENISNSLTEYENVDFDLAEKYTCDFNAEYDNDFDFGTHF